MRYMRMKKGLGTHEKGPGYEATSGPTGGIS